MATYDGPWQNHCRIEWVYSYSSVGQGTTHSQPYVEAYLRAETNWDQYYTGSKSWSGHWGSGSQSQYYGFDRSGPRIQIVSGGGPSVALTDTVQSRTFSVTANHYFGSTSHSLTFSIPARFAVKPSGLTVSRVSDAQHSLSWTRGSTYSGAVVQRRTDDGVWQEVGRPSGNVSSWTDTSTVADRKYEYRVAGLNKNAPGGVGQSAWSDVATVFTTPAPVASVAATRSGMDISVNVDGLPAYATEYDVYDNAVLVVSNVTSWPWLHVAPNPSITHQYSVVSKRDGLSSVLSSPSNTVQLQAPPNTPMGLTPNGGVVASDEQLTFKWVHNPVDSSPQTSFEVQYRVTPDPVWYTSGEIVSGVSRWDFGLLFGGDIVEWRVRTKGADPGWSPWSATATVDVVTRPGVAVIQPDGGWGEPVLPVEWSYLQAHGRPQSGWRVELLDGDGQRLEYREGSGAQTTYTLSTRLQHDLTYTVKVWGATGAVWSAPASSTFTVVFVEPAPADVSGGWVEESGSVELAVQDGRGTIRDDVVNLFTNPRLKGDGTWAEVARWNTGDPIPVVVQPEDFRIRDLGTGESVMEIERVAGLTAVRCIAGVSSIGEEPAIRLIPTGGTLGQSCYAYFDIPAGPARSSGTLVGRSASLGSDNLIVTYKRTLAVQTPFATIPNPPDTGSHSQRFAYGALTSTYQALFYGNGAQDSHDTYWTDIGLFAGTYDGPAFNGSSGQITVGDSVMVTEWDGEEDNSLSRAVMAPETLTIDIERSVDGNIWEPWLTGLDAAEMQHLTDWLSLSRGLTLYRVTAWASSGAASTRIFEVYADSEAVWLSGGVSFEITARLPFDPVPTITPGRARVGKRYAGRSKPVAYSGDAVSRLVHITGRTTDYELSGEETASVDRLTLLAQESAPVHMVRTPDGQRFFGIISEVPMAREGATPHESGWNGTWGYSFTLEESER